MTQDVLSTAFFDKEYEFAQAPTDAGPSASQINVMLINFSLGDHQQMIQSLTYHRRSKTIPINILTRQQAYSADIIVANIRQTHAEKAIQLFRRLHPDTPMLLIGDVTRADHTAHPLIITDIDVTSNSLERQIRRLFAQTRSIKSLSQQKPLPVRQAPFGRVLVIDDSALVRKQMSRYLNKRQFECVTASSAEEALFAAHSEHFDIIFLDVVMPKINGFRTCQALRKMKDYAGTPIIMLTADDTSANRIHAMMSGCTRFETKPLRSSRLNTILQESIPAYDTRVSNTAQTSHQTTSPVAPVPSEETQEFMDALSFITMKPMAATDLGLG